MYEKRAERGHAISLTRKRYRLHALKEWNSMMLAAGKKGNRGVPRIKSCNRGAVD